MPFLGVLVTLLQDRRWFWHRVILGLLLGIAGSVIARRAFNEWGADLAQLYMAAWLLREGKNVYDMQEQHSGYMRHIGEVTTWGHFYPPGASVALVPATVIPYAWARELYFWVCLGVMLYGLWRFMATYIVRWDSSLRALVLGMVMCAACTRWGFKVGQPIPMILGLFSLFLVELKGKRSWTLVATAGLVGAIKATFGIPFLILAAGLRRYKVATALVVLWGSLNLIGILGHGGFHILQDYRANMADFERPDQLNYPDPRGFNSLARTDWPYVMNAVDPNFHRNTLIGYCLSLLTMAWLVREVLSAKKSTMNEDSAALALSAPAAAFSMLAVYHHHYDISILVAPFLAYVGRSEFRSLRAAWFFIVPVALYAGLYPYAKFADVLQAAMGDASVLFTKPLACVVCIMALVSSCFVLRSILKQRGEVTPASTGTVGGQLSTPST